jgi:RNA polymerase sigma-70 factor, ECF subfamily
MGHSSFQPVPAMPTATPSKRPRGGLSPVHASFAGAVAAGLRAQAEAAQVGEALDARLAEAAAAHPALRVAPERLAARLAEGLSLSSGSGDEVAAAVRALHAEDLLLALACEAGDRAALRTLDQALTDAVPRAAARLRPSNTFVDEVAQQLRQKLLVAPEGGRTKLRDYKGRGALAHWLRAAALRLSLNLLESEAPQRRAARPQQGEGQQGSGPLDRMAAAGPDPELGLIKRRYAPQFRAALESALAGLGPKERNLLRLYFAQGLTVEEIGRLEGTHKSTISRWLTRARVQLLAEVRAQLGRSLSLGDRELDSLLAAVGSQLHISLGKVL